MDIKRSLTRMLMGWLPAEEQAHMIARLVAWVYSDLPPAEQEELVLQVRPALEERLRQGHFGLRLLLYTHLVRLPALRWLKLSGPPTDLAGIRPCGADMTRVQEGAHR
jgi:hypothetical protein